MQLIRLSFKPYVSLKALLQYHSTDAFGLLLVFFLLLKSFVFMSSNLWQFSPFCMWIDRHYYHFCSDGSRLGYLPKVAWKVVRPGFKFKSDSSMAQPYCYVAFSCLCPPTCTHEREGKNLESGTSEGTEIWEEEVSSCVGEGQKSF